MNKNLVILYTKFPEIGKSKTRIAKESTELFAYIVSLCTLKDTINKVSNSKSYDFIAVVNSEAESQFFREKLGLNVYVLNESLLQSDQSQRFSFLFSHFKKSYEKVILIPSDVPSIAESSLINAFNILENNNYVFGPEYNGGVYLIGMNKNPDNIFDRIRWSTENSLKDLVKNSKSKSYLLKLKGDLNKLEDLNLFKEDIEKRSPLLYEFLTNNFYKEVKINYAYN
jgi:glycosyltransferase A (GT-A) superfamily protein (DUF2064 family)